MHTSHLTRLRLTLGEDGWGSLTVARAADSVTVRISYVVDVVGQLVGATLAALDGRDVRLDWDSESALAEVVIAGLDDGDLRLTLAWASVRQVDDTGVRFRIDTQQPASVLVACVLGMVDELDPDAYAEEWSSVWPAEQIAALRSWSPGTGA